MYLNVAVLLFYAGLAVNSERHSLTYTYTALSRPFPLPGIHTFTAMGMLDSRVIDYFDSSTQKKVPRQTWMKERLDSDYWEGGTRSRQSKQHWFKVNIGILMKRMRQNDSDVHVLQWRHGCEADMEPSGSLKFRRAMDMYSYDGSDFLYFDTAHAVWVAPMDAALETKRRWDGLQLLKDYTVGYLEDECMQWLEEFLKFSQESMRAAPPPEVYLSVKKSKVEINLILTCLVTGFYSKEVILNIKRNGRILTKQDGVQSSGVWPNEDETYQRKDQVEVLKSDESNYTCEVVHAASSLYIERVWDHKPPVDGVFVGVIVAAVGLLFVLVCGGLVFILKESAAAPPAIVFTAPTSEKSRASTDSGMSSMDESKRSSIPEVQGLMEGNGQDGHDRQDGHDG